LGALSGALFGLLAALPSAVRVLAGVLACAAIAGGLIYARFQRMHKTLVLSRRASKLWTRGLPAFALAASLGGLLRAPNALQLSLAALLLGCCGLLRASYRWRGPDRTPCTLCPERDRAPCSGYRSIVQAERAFTRRAGRLLELDARDRACSS
jgi:hypothetical protein